MNIEDLDDDMLELLSFFRDEEMKNHGGPWEKITGYKIKKSDLGLSNDYVNLMLTRGYFNAIFYECQEVIEFIEKKYCT